jgi:CDP-diacylglycerol--glycerol-3-phosphate 3-phosphatidyltransferase
MVPEPGDLRRYLPNVLTLLRFVAVPIFALLFVSAGSEGAVGAGLFFAGAAATDQIDGWLARRWHVESRFGRVADPLADRLMISVAAILLWHDGRLPWPGAVIVIARDVLLVVGYQLLAPRGLAIGVTRLGKLGTWILYAALAGLIVTDRGTDWPLWLFWLGLALALGAAVQYVVAARRGVGEGHGPAARTRTGRSS